MKKIYWIKFYFISPSISSYRRKIKFDKAEKCDIACKKNPLNFVEFSRGWFHSVIPKINLIKLL